jgi:uncharacterized protein YdaU (DUF1376 family)
MRMWARRWLDDDRIRGRGDDGQREAGITLEQEGVYIRLCLTQFLSADGYLPNRRGFLCDAVACPVASFDTLVAPVLQRFFKRASKGDFLFNVRTRSEWEHANAKSIQAKQAADLKWQKKKASLAPADADAHADAGCEKEKERERESEKESEKEIENNSNNSSGAPAPDGAAEELSIEETIAALKPTEIADRFMGVYNAVHRRRCTVTPAQRDKIVALARRYRPWQLIALPVVVEAHHRQDLYPADAIASKPEILLRDGKTPRPTGGATNWLERALQLLDRTVLDTELAEIVRQAGVLAQLQQCGVTVRTDDEAA